MKTWQENQKHNNKQKTEQQAATNVNTPQIHKNNSKTENRTTNIKQFVAVVLKQQKQTQQRQKQTKNTTNQQTAAKTETPNSKIISNTAELKTHTKTQQIKRTKLQTKQQHNNKTETKKQTKIKTAKSQTKQ